jgi:hypothetical protein
VSLLQRSQLEELVALSRSRDDNLVQRHGSALSWLWTQLTGGANIVSPSN